MSGTWAAVGTDQMEDLPVHVAVEELIRMIFLEQKQQFVRDKFSITLDIKSCKTGNDNAQQELFKIKLYCIGSISDISTYLKDGLIKTLQFLVERMQSFIKNESHLCQIEKCHLDDNHALQRNYFFIKNPQNKTTDLSEITLSINKVLQSQATWYLRIYQNHGHMLNECSKILDYMKKLRILNPSDEFKYKLKVSGIKCNPDLSTNNYIEVCNKRILVGLHQNTKTSEMRDISRKTFIGTTTSLTISTKENIYQNIFTLTCLGFLFPLADKNAREKQHLIEFFSFGPYGEPLKLPHTILNFISWEKYGLKALLNNPFENTNSSLQPEVCLITQLTNGNTSRCQKFCVVIYIMFDNTNKMHAKSLHILGHLHNNLKSIFDTNERNVRIAIESFTNLVFQTDTSSHENTNEDSFTSVSESIANIVRRSTNEEFQENCFHAMKSSSIQEMKATIMNRLKKL